MGGEACGLGEGTHYGCECVTRRLAEAEARASGLESALAVAGEENAALTESRDAALRSLASEQARRETAERERDRYAADLSETNRVLYARQGEHAMERDLAAKALSAALRRAEELETALRALHDAVAGIVFRDEGGRTFVASPPETIHRATFAMADAYDVLVPRALSVGVSRTGTGGDAADERGGP
jgi:hypothetical protein